MLSQSRKSHSRKQRRLLLTRKCRALFRKAFCLASPWFRFATIVPANFAARASTLSASQRKLKRTNHHGRGRRERACLVRERERLCRFECPRESSDHLRRSTSLLLFPRLTRLAQTSLAPTRKDCFLVARTNRVRRHESRRTNRPARRRKLLIHLHAASASANLFRRRPESSLQFASRARC